MFVSSRLPRRGRCVPSGLRNAACDTGVKEADCEETPLPPPQPGEVCPGFVTQPDRCWRMVYDGCLQAAHCTAAPAWSGRWFAPSGARWWRVWACPDHLDGLTGLRAFAA